MTAPAAAPASGPVAPPVQRASAQPPTDRFAFAAVLDALPAAASKAGASTAEGQPHVAKESREDGSSSRQSARHSLLSDGALLASLPFALSAASAMDAGSQAAGQASSLAPAAAKASGAEASGASVAASDRTDRCWTARWRTRLSLRRPGSPSAFASRGLTGEASFALAGASGQDLATQVNRSGESAPPPASPRRRPPRARTPLHPAAPRRPRRRSPHAHARLRRIGRARRERQRRMRPCAANASPKLQRRRPPGLRVRRSRPRRRIRAATGLTAAFPIRPAPPLHRWRKRIRSARFSQRLSPLRRLWGSMVRPRPRGRRSRRAPARPPRAPPPLARQSRRSTSIFRRAGSRTSR